MRDPTRVLFVCLHGSAKSVIAAHHLLRLAAEYGQSVEAGSAGVDPDPAIPPHVIAGLAADGIHVGSEPPRAVSDDAIAAAEVVVSLGCDIGVPAITERGTRLVRWDDVPAVSDGYEPARDAIVQRLHVLLEEISRRNGLS